MALIITPAIYNPLILCLSYGTQMRMFAVGLDAVEQISQTPPLFVPKTPKVPDTWDVAFTDLSFSYQDAVDPLRVMALALYACIPVAAAIIVVSMKIFARLSRRNIEAKDKAATYLNEYLFGLKTLRAYNQTGAGFTKLKDAYHHLMDVSLRAETAGGVLINLSAAFVRMGLPLTCFAGAYLILGGRLSVVDYISLIIIGTKILSPLLTRVEYMTPALTQIFII
jgi:ABC-type multidrug transport system fused ATPase/permease subunit